MLTTVNLWDNPIGDEGGEHLAAALKINQVKGTYANLYIYFIRAITTDTYNIGNFFL